MNKLYIVLAVGLILGYAGGAVVGPRQLLNSEGSDSDAVEAAGEDVAVATLLQEQEAPDAGDSELQKLLDAKMLEINELNAALDNARLEIARNVAELANLNSAKAEPEGEQKSWAERRKERQEQWKKDNPEEYEAMQKRREEFQGKMEGVIADKSAYLVNLDTSDMTDKEKESHEELLGRIAEAWEVMNGMQEGKWPSGEQMSGMRENYEAIKDLYAQERDYALRQVGKDLGYSATDSAEFSTSMQNVFENTSPSLPRGMFGSRGRSSRGRSSEKPKVDAVK